MIVVDPRNQPLNFFQNLVINRGDVVVVGMTDIEFVGRVVVMIGGGWVFSVQSHFHVNPTYVMLG